MNKKDASKKITGIILAAGNSIRFGKNRNKNFEKINNKPVLAYSLNMFANNNKIDNILVAAKESEIEEIKKIIEAENISKDIKIILGGKTRMESAYNCIKFADSDIVIIQDGARPLIKEEYIEKCIEEMENYKGVTIGVKAKDTIKVSDDSGIVKETTNRINIWQIQTPQCFDRKILLSVHEKYGSEGATDDCSLLEKENYKVKIIDGDYSNIKITTYDDLEIVKNYLK